MGGAGEGAGFMVVSEQMCEQPSEQSWQRKTEDEERPNCSHGPGGGGGGAGNGDTFEKKIRRRETPQEPSVGPVEDKCPHRSSNSYQRLLGVWGRGLNCCTILIGCLISQVPTG